MNAMTQTTAPVPVKGGTHPALSQLRDPHLLREMAYIDGRWTAAVGDARFEVNDPATGLIIARVSRLGPEAANQAIAAAARALPAWKALLPQERAKHLRAWHALILEALEDLALIMTLEQGKPLSESRGEIAYAASFVEWYSEEAKSLNVESVTSHLLGAEMLVCREA